MTVLPLWLFVVAGCSLLVFAVTVAFVPRGQRLALFIVLVSVCAIAATAGITGGLSREGAVGEVMAAALGLLGGVVIYLFGSDRTQGVSVSVCGFAFSLALVVAYFEAASRRGAPESYVFWRAQCAEKYSDRELLNDRVARVVLDRSIGGLCAEIFKNERAVNLIDAR